MLSQHIPKGCRMKLTDAEWKVMNVAWERNSVTAREVLRAIGDDTGWAYTTTKTVMARLAEKGALAVEMSGNTSIYTPLITRTDARGTEVRTLLDRAFEGTLVPLMHFLLAREKLSDREKDKLREMLEEQERDDADQGA